MKLKIAAIVVLLLAGAGALYVSFGGLPTSAAAASTYLTAAAVVGDVSNTVAATGSVASSASYGLAFGSPAHLASSTASSSASSTTWPVLEVKVKVGDPVKKGDHLASASTVNLAAQATAALAGRRSAALQLTIAKETLAAAVGISAIRSAQMQVYSAQTQFVQAQKTESDVAAQAAAATLVAPIDGVVTAVNVKAALNAPSGDAIVVEATTYQVSADVVESDVTSISVGQVAIVTVTAINSQIDGTVSAIAPAASTSTSGGVVSYGVTVTLGATPPGLRPGMTADIQVTTASAASVLTIPSAALRGSAGSYTVQVLDAGGLPQARQVTVGLVTNSVAEIRSGLTAGESVITGTTATRTGTTTQGGGGGGGGGAIPGGGGFIRGGGGG